MAKQKRKQVAKAKKQRRVQAVVEPERFFAKLDSIHRGIAARQEAPSIPQFGLRTQLLTKHFATERSFSRYVKKHPISTLVMEKIERQLSLHGHDLARPGQQQNNPNANDTLERYRSLAIGHYVDPGSIFPEIPSIPYLSELKAIVKAKRHIGNLAWQRTLENQRADSTAFLQNRWRAITGRDFSIDDWPALAEILPLIAPVPVRPGWSRDLASREAPLMGHQPALAELRPGRRVDKQAVPSGQGGQRDGCDFDALNQLAGAARLKQPIGEEPRYTFPGEPLGQREDIFYDYAVMIPIADDGLVSPEALRPYSRNLEGAFLLARMAKSLLTYLDRQHLTDALGVDGNHRVIDDLNHLLDRVLTTAPDASTENIRAIRRDLKQMAVSIRTISRARILTSSLVPADPSQFLQALTAALTAVPWRGTRNRYVPSTQGNGEILPTLELSDPAAPENAGVFREVADYEGQFVAPDANDDSRVDLEWTWQTTFQDKTLRRYVQYLGGTFSAKISALVDAATEMRDAVQSFASGNPAALDQFARLAEATIHDVLFGLERLFDQTAEQIALEKTTPAEGTKRLALMVTFRQYWHPAGYVQGKLVGYKNLLPNQRETMKRRTFVKTTREMTTVQEFAASRDEDYSRSSKETSEIINEGSKQFNLTINASGHFDIGIAGVSTTVTNNDTFQQMSRQTQNHVAEVTMKSSAKYSEKREVKIRQLTEIEDVQEVTTELANLNREITANYFYYQLLRQYSVTMELHDMRPVLLRAREVPGPGSVDEKFLADNADVLVRALPAQLSLDLQETAGRIESLTRSMVRRRSDLDKRRATYEVFVRLQPPQDIEGATRWQAQLDSMERLLADAQTAFDNAEGDFLSAQTRLDRVLSHVRENITFYMQFIWQTSPKVDQDRLLQAPEEYVNGLPLAQVTRGLSRLGYFGNEEIFEYDGISVALFELLVRNLISGSELVTKDVQNSAMYQQLRQYYASDGNSESLLNQIRSHAFVSDPAGPTDVFNTRSVQVAQDALIVETFPGQVPLLEGFQMIHRMLDVQKVCLENTHLNERINDRAWQKSGEDSYKVLRRDGQPGPSEQEIDVNFSSAVHPTNP